MIRFGLQVLWALFSVFGVGIVKRIFFYHLLKYLPILGKGRETFGSNDRDMIGQSSVKCFYLGARSAIQFEMKREDEEPSTRPYVEDNRSAEKRYWQLSTLFISRTCFHAIMIMMSLFPQIELIQELRNWCFCSPLFSDLNNELSYGR